LKTKVLT